MKTDQILPKEDQQQAQEELNLALALAALEGNNKEIVRLLTVGKLGILAEVNYGESTNNITALYTAISINQLESVKILIANGADVNNPTRAVNAENLNVQGANLVAPPQTYPLYRAVKEGYLNIVNELLKAGADPYCVGSDLKTPLELAEENLKKGTGKGWLNDWSIVDVLKKACKAKNMSEADLVTVKKERHEQISNYFNLFYNKHDKKRVPTEESELLDADEDNNLSKSVPNSKKQRVEKQKELSESDLSVKISNSMPDPKKTTFNK